MNFFNLLQTKKFTLTYIKNVPKLMVHPVHISHRRFFSSRGENIDNKLGSKT